MRKGCASNFNESCTERRERVVPELGQQSLRFRIAGGKGALCTVTHYIVRLVPQECVAEISLSRYSLTLDTKPAI